MFRRKGRQGKSVEATPQAASEIGDRVLITREEEKKMKREMGIKDDSIAVLWELDGRPGVFVFVNVGRSRAWYLSECDRLVRTKGRELTGREEFDLVGASLNNQDFWMRDPSESEDLEDSGIDGPIQIFEYSIELGEIARPSGQSRAD